MSHDLDAESGESCAIQPNRARYSADLSPQLTDYQLALAFGFLLG
jgi:hypothetical protein